MATPEPDGPRSTGPGSDVHGASGRPHHAARLTKAVIPAAGLGTRFLPATKATPKEMLPLVDTPVIQFIVEEAVRAGLDDVLLVTGRSKRALEDHFDSAYELEATLRAKGDDAKLALVQDSTHLADVHSTEEAGATGSPGVRVVGPDRAPSSEVLLSDPGRCRSRFSRDR